jgi:hypothetical protein
MDIAQGRTEMPAAVPRRVQLVPPARVDLVDEVLVRVGRRDLNLTLDWPPVHLVHQLAFRVKRMHLGEVRMRGPEGLVVDMIRYRDKMQQDRRIYRLTRHGVFVGEYKTPEELAKVIDLADLVEDDREPNYCSVTWAAVGTSSSRIRRYGPALSVVTSTGTGP